MPIAAPLIAAVAANAGKIAAGAAIAAVSSGTTYVITTKKDDEKFQKQAADIYELGLKKGISLASYKAKKLFIDPLIAKIAVVYLIALSDGEISRAERKQINDIINGITANPEFPKAAVNTINDIINHDTLSFSDIKGYLDIIDIDTLIAFEKDLIAIAEASDGISYKESVIIDVFKNYVDNRKQSEQPKIKRSFLRDNQSESLDDYFSSFVSEDEIQDQVNNFSIRMKMLDMDFKRKTKLDKKEVSLLFFAVCLQCIRIYLADNLTKIEQANHGEREHFLHNKQKQILEKFKSDSENVAKPYYAPMSEIISTKGVPYDATAYAHGNLKLFKGENGKKGVNHRFATLGHDPLIGLLIGTVNIMTNTITTTQSTALVPITNHVIYDVGFKNPKISKSASLSTAITTTIERSKEDLTPLVASFIKQLIHIATDVYTPAGIQLPGANIVFDRIIVENLTKYVSSGDVIKIGASATIAELINKLIEILHGCMLLEANSSLEDSVNKVKTKKIVLYSNAIVSSSNVIAEFVLGQYDQLDLGGLIILMKRLFKDVDFIYDVKFEFIKNGLINDDILLQGEISEQYN